MKTDIIRQLQLSMKQISVKEYFNQRFPDIPKSDYRLHQFDFHDMVDFAEQYAAIKAKEAASEGWDAADKRAYSDGYPNKQKFMKRYKSKLENI